VKVEKAAGPGGARRVVEAYAKAPAHAPEVSPAATVPPVTASAFGIPEEEFTPRVRDAIVTLMHEVGRLRGEVEQMRGRLQDAARSADQDMLLPILNRRAFVRETGRFIAFAERHGTPSCLIYFDLNDFKSINDRFGHAAGDAVLAHFAETILGQLRDSDIVARLGGDEFGVLLPHVTREQAVKKAASVAATLTAQPAKWRGHSLPVKFSYGVHQLRAGESPDAAMAKADRQMYAQKRSDR
jgi:diguanylate cyclase (GGDEF)-like protein